MEKEFIPYQEAFALKELGFDEPCFGWFASDKSLVKDITIKTDFTLAPTFSQAFKFFRGKYGYDCSFEDELVYDDDDKEIEMWDFFIYKTKQASDKKMTFCSNNSDTYIKSFSREEAELACLRELILIVKNK